jgi:hypothetical protein
VILIRPGAFWRWLKFTMAARVRTPHRLLSEHGVINHVVEPADYGEMSVSALVGISACSEGLVLVRPPLIERSNIFSIM